MLPGRTKSVPVYGALPDIEEPKDPCRLAYMLLFALGLGSMFPWNVFINASSYFGNRLCGSDFYNTFLNWFGLLNGACRCAGLMLALLYQHRVSQDKRVLFPLIINTTVFVATTGLVLIDPPNLSGTNFFLITLGLVGLSGFSNAFLTGGVFGLAAQLPPIYTQAIMSGQGLGGLTVAVTSLLTTLASPDNEGKCVGNKPLSPYSTVKWGAFVYFMVSVAVLLGCLIGYLVLVNLAFVRHHVEKSRSAALAKLLELRQGADEMHVPLLQPPHPIFDSGALISTFWLVSKFAFCVFSVLCITLSVFPTVTVQIESTSGSGFLTQTFTAITFVEIAIGDFLGRMAAGVVGIKPGGGKFLVFWCLARLIFIPAYLFCTTPYSQANGIDFFKSDTYPFTFMALFSLSNGFLSSLAMMYGPSQAPNNRQVAGTIMASALAFGVFAGSCISFAFAPLATV